MGKELSSYPPDRWIRQMNRTYPGIWTELRKAYAHPGSIFRNSPEGMAMISRIPEWCIMPTMFPMATMMQRYGDAFCFSRMDELMTLASAYTWRCSKGVYRFAPEIYDALTQQPLTGDLPTDCLYRLPEWAVYIETPGLLYERRPVDGFIAHLDYNLFSQGVDLQFAIFWNGIDMPKTVALPLGEGSLLDAMERTDRVDDVFMGPIRQQRYVGTRQEYIQSFSAMLQLILYLCSDEPDMPAIEHPQKRRRSAGRIQLPDEPRVWDVGVRISAAIRNGIHRQEERVGETGRELGSHASPRPHVRSAHWHTFWTGPRQAVFPERKPVIRWIPPIPVGMNWKHELPTSIHQIAE